MKILKSLSNLRNAFFQLIFWGWNLIFLSVVYCGILPLVGIWLLIATFEGDIPLDFSLTLLALIAIPTASTIYGAKYLSQQPEKLMQWFYGVEAPLVTWCLVRLFLIRELTFANTLILGTMLVCITAFAIEVLRGYRANQKVFSWVQAIAHTLMLFTGVYLGTVLLFYALPVAGYIIEGTVLWFMGLVMQLVSFNWETIPQEAYYLTRDFFTLNWFEGLLKALASVATWGWFLIFGICLILLFGFSAALFVGMPFAITNLYINSGGKVLKAFAQKHGKIRAIQVGIVVVATWLLVFNIFNQQPQVKAFSLLASTSDRQELLANSDTIRRGLINANLYPYRYLSTKEGNDHIYNMYDRLHLPQSVSRFFQNRYNQLLSPFLYQGSQGDVEKAAQLYAEFFDAPIQQGERQAVRHAIQSTAIVDEAKAGLLNIDQKKVWLAKQEVNITPQGDWADVEIHEVYENQTNDVEEILYYFSLPESAAITGLWLGDSENLEQRFAYQVAPRGAAQEVYNSQVERTRPIDPALLEQVGPGQYRLRAFPVPPKRTVSEIERGADQAKMHLWLTYKVMQQEQGWALPKLAEKRNIYWTWQTKRIRDDKVERIFADTWLEDFAVKSNNSARQTHQLNLPGGYSVNLKPLSQQDYVLPQNQKYAIILDTSYSMGDRQIEINQSIDWWQKNLTNQTNNQVDLYLTDVDSTKAKRLSNFNSLESGNLIFYGSLQTSDLLQQFAALRDNQDYDAILLLTDKGSYELATDQPALPAINAPLWMVHLGGELPKAYEDNILQAIQNSNGGVATDIPTVIKRLGTEAAKATLVVDDYSWTVNKSDANTGSTPELAALAARQVVSSLTSQANHQLSIKQLDAVHQLAKEQSIVTPYSSMIVLVNDQQREQLKAAEARTDRFEREVESGTEQLETPFNPFETAEVSGVPEPDLWLLLGIVILALYLVMQRQKIQQN
jgi:putative PEP-CTERM system integral membrane protein